MRGIYIIGFSRSLSRGAYLKLYQLVSLLDRFSEAVRPLLYYLNISVVGLLQYRFQILCFIGAQYILTYSTLLPLNRTTGHCLQRLFFHEIQGTLTETKVRRFLGQPAPQHFTGTSPHTKFTGRDIGISLRVLTILFPLRTIVVKIGASMLHMTCMLLKHGC